VATPIGNLEDISARALRLLREVRLVAAEDTRHTKKLLMHYAISPRVLSYYEHNKLTRVAEILAELEQGDVALVSDAGTPALNDPGFELVRAALQAGHSVSPVPGPCAPVAALVASGLPTDAFLYLGYLPRKSPERRRALEKVRDLPYTLVFLEAPHRLLAALDDLAAVLGDRQVSVARELTKLHEEIYRGGVGEAQAYFTHQPPRGEFTLVVAGAVVETNRWSESRLLAALATARGGEQSTGGEPPAQLARRLAAESGWRKEEVYAMLSRLQRVERQGRDSENRGS
jgi:16S rRNA (cytidine1402-2'-O)-methyltransferase